MRVDHRTVPRFFLNPSLPAFANGKSVRVVDLSTKGARLHLVETLQPGEQVYLQIIAGNREIVVEGTVLWCEIDSLLVDMLHDSYLAGIAFAHASTVVGAFLEEMTGTAALRIEDFRSHDRYRVTAPLTGSFGDGVPVSVLDLSIRGARIALAADVGAGSGGVLRFQVDEESGPTEVYGKVVWTAPSVTREIHAGLQITGEDEALRKAIHRLLVRNEARIDLDSLRHKFDQMRAQAARQALAG